MNSKNIHVLSRAVIIDQGHILLCKTLDLSINFYFLPGGHVEHKESAENTLIRELSEEIGAMCKVKRFLGCFEHSFALFHNSICHDHEYNFIFEATLDSLNPSNEIPQLESHIKPIWLPLDKINDIDFRPRSLFPIIMKWLENEPNNLLQSEMQ